MTDSEPRTDPRQPLGVRYDSILRVRDETSAFLATISQEEEESMNTTDPMRVTNMNITHDVSFTVENGPEITFDGRVLTVEPEEGQTFQVGRGRACFDTGLNLVSLSLAPKVGSDWRLTVNSLTRASVRAVIPLIARVRDDLRSILA